MQRLVALPITGEAFLYGRDGIHVLVDSGWSGSSLAKALRVCAPHLTRIDVAVCTHGDSDHAGGLATLLDHWRGRIGQLWLPGRWVEVIPRLLMDAKQLVNALVDDLVSLARDRTDLNAENLDAEEIERLLDTEAVRQLQPDGDDSDSDEPVTEIDRQDLDDFDEPSWMREMRERAEEIVAHDPVAQRAFASARSRVYYRMRRGIVGQGLGRYWLSLIQTEENIRKIARHAVTHSIRIRWFDYGGFEERTKPSGGVRGLLVPIDAVEQSPPPRIGLRLWESLSRINRESLVFYAPEANSWPGILFMADSPLGTGTGFLTPFRLPQLKPLRAIIATAPHHGAESAACAYRNLSHWAVVALWIRTGGLPRHPEKTFRSLPATNRTCTHCPHMNLQLRPVDISFCDTATCQYFGPYSPCTC
jgi:hypothetical protein